MNRLDPLPTASWQRVSPKYIVVDLLGILISAVIFTVGSSVPWLLTGQPWLLLLPAAMLVIHLLVAAFTPRRVRAIGFLLRDDDLVFRRGIMFLRVVAVPYGRMQLVDIRLGDLQLGVEPLDSGELEQDVRLPEIGRASCRERV